MKYTSRGTVNETIKIECPKHGTQRTYDLGEGKKQVAVGCEKCFAELPYKELNYENKLEK